MGIRGLNTYIRQHHPRQRRPIHWSDHQHQTWAIDGTCLIYGAIANNLSPIAVIASLLVRMRAAKVRAIVVFDGKPPISKSATLDERRRTREAALTEMANLRKSDPELQNPFTAKRWSLLQRRAPVCTREIRDTVKQFLYAAGILFITATGEADGLLAALDMPVVSNDTDMLALGVSTLILPETADYSILKAISLNGLLDSLGLSYSQFVDACVFMGTDHKPSMWRSLSPAAAIDAVKRGLDFRIDAHVLEALEIEAAHIMERPSVESLLSEWQLIKWRAGAPPIETENLKSLAKTHDLPHDWSTILVAG